MKKHYKQITLIATVEIPEDKKDSLFFADWNMKEDITNVLQNNCANSYELKDIDILEYWADEKGRLL